MSEVINNLNKIKESLISYPNTTVISELNIYNLEETKIILDSDVTDVSENRKEPFMEKHNAFKKYPCKWHFFGTLTPFSSMNNAFIDSIDYLHTLESIDVAGVINKVRDEKKILDCFVRVDVCDEKGPITPLKLISFIKQLKRFPKIRIIGLSCMCKFTYDEELLNKWFNKMNELREKVKSLNLDYAPCEYLSMGTNNDYLIACKCGSTHIHIGKIL